MRQIDESSRQDNTQAAALMEARGVSVVAVDQSDVADWRASIEALYPELARMRELDAELFNELLALLEAYRADN
jgi:TRAP-type C4-dicarboxylate transport system substrate-binding protein